jgi:hypothetical protein
MSSLRVIVLFLATVVAAGLIASCAEQPLPTGPSSGPLQPAPRPGSAVPQLVDMNADPTEPEFGTRATTPIVYPSGTPPDPWPPGPPPKAKPGVPVPTDPTTTAQMHITIDPEPVMHSGVPVPVSGCDNHPYTWYYSQVLVNDSAVAITITSRENFFDGRYTSTNAQAINIAPQGTVMVDTRWCSGYAMPHYAQTRFKGRDQTGATFVISAPWARLLAP